MFTFSKVEDLWDSLVSPLVFPTRIPIKLVIWMKEMTPSYTVTNPVVWCFVPAQCLLQLRHSSVLAVLTDSTTTWVMLLSLGSQLKCPEFWTCDAFPCIVCYRQMSRRAYHFSLQCWTYMYEQWDNVNVLLTKQWTCDVFIWLTQLCFWKW